jgi:OmpA-OmpF porin, OOP family
MRLPVAAVLFALLCLPVQALAQDADGCTDHPLFNRLPNFFIVGCDVSQFDLTKFPKGPLTPDAEGTKRPTNVDVEGPVWKINYELKEGVTKPSPLQIMRNFQAAAKKAGGTIEGEYPGWCEGMLDDSLRIGNNCTHYGVSMRFVKGETETFAYVQPGDGQSYQLVLAEREGMKQDIVASELLDKINKDGFVALYINFETGKATIQPDSDDVLNQVAEMLKGQPALNLEVAGHTDNVGTPDANLKLSDERAKAVVAALTARGVAASRLGAKGYGQGSPIADNRTEDGRATNRRVELVKR